MSRIGKKIIKIPEGVTVTTSGNLVTVKGPKGELKYSVVPNVKVAATGEGVMVSVVEQTKGSSAYWGLVRSLVANMIQGVSQGFEKKLELVGVGYRVKPGEGGIVLTVGYSHPVEFRAPEGIEFLVEDNNKITIKGADRQLVGLTAAKIRELKKPEPYKGKGIKYVGEVIRRKAGKTGKA